MQHLNSLVVWEMIPEANRCMSEGCEMCVEQRRRVVCCWSGTGSQCVHREEIHHRSSADIQTGGRRSRCLKLHETRAWHSLSSIPHLDLLVWWSRYDYAIVVLDDLRGGGAGFLRRFVENHDSDQFLRWGCSSLPRSSPDQAIHHLRCCRRCFRKHSDRNSGPNPEDFLDLRQLHLLGYRPLTEEKATTMPEQAALPPKSFLITLSPT